MMQNEIENNQHIVFMCVQAAKEGIQFLFWETAHFFRHLRNLPSLSAGACCCCAQKRAATAFAARCVSSFHDMSSLFQQTHTHTRTHWRIVLQYACLQQPSCLARPMGLSQRNALLPAIAKLLHCCDACVCVRLCDGILFVFSAALVNLCTCRLHVQVHSLVRL